MPAISGPELYSISQGVKCSGDCRCHWCNSPCSRLWPHDDPPPIVGYRSHSSARCPAEPFLCTGCWLWRRKKITIPFLSGGYKDGQSPCNWPWLVTESGAWALRREDGESLFEMLLQPPVRFALILCDRPPCWPHQAIVNNLFEIKADTLLAFTVNGIPHNYTPYGLQETLRSGKAIGKGPGEAALTRLFGFHKPANLPPPTDDMLARGIDKGNKGRPVSGKENNPHRVIVASGSPGGRR